MLIDLLARHVRDRLDAISYDDGDDSEIHELELDEVELDEADRDELKARLLAPLLGEAAAIYGDALSRRIGP